VRSADVNGKGDRTTKFGADFCRATFGGRPPFRFSARNQYFQVTDHTSRIVAHVGGQLWGSTQRFLKIFLGECKLR
jgi:hypothetical protein